MSDSVIYDNIFEAIRALDKNNIVLSALGGRSGGVIRRQNYITLKLPDGKYGFFLNSLSLQFFRGESQVFDHCKPSLYRIVDKGDRVIAQLRAIEFVSFLKTFPDLSKAEEDGRYIDYKALAQHYGFATDMLDLTNDILTAAYFATHVFDPYTNNTAVAGEGTGQIRYTTLLPEPDGRLHMIGMQPLARPGLQSAYGMILTEDEDFASMSNIVRFKQDPDKNMLFHSLFLQGNDLYFPNEGVVAAAEKIKYAPAITSMAIHKYCEEKKADVAKIRKLVTDKDLYIVDAPLVCNNMPFDKTDVMPSGAKNLRPIMIIG